LLYVNFKPWTMPQILAKTKVDRPRLHVKSLIERPLGFLIRLPQAEMPTLHI